MQLTSDYILEKANNGIVGLDDKLDVYGGYDDSFLVAGAKYEPMVWDDEDSGMSDYQKMELADVMIARWQKYRDIVESK